MELFSFDRGYLERLQAGEPETERHFVAYFNQLILIKLRSRALPSDVIQEIRQETFVRVLSAIRKKTGVQHPDRLGSFVNSVCNHVLLEYHRSSHRYDPLDETRPEIPDKTIDLDGQLLSAEAQKSVHTVLMKLPQKDREVIRAVLLEEVDKDWICRRLGVDRDYLRVLLHRAKQNFRSYYEREMAGASKP